jgi:putative hemolysin
MLDIPAGKYAVRFSRAPRDILAAQNLRHQAFVAPRGDGRADRTLADGRDADALDARCQHGLIQAVATGELVGCFRLMILPDGRAIGQSYSAQFYDLSRLSGFAGPMVEIGRFCVRPGLRDPDILRAAWAALTRLVDQYGVEMLFGCSSFEGAAAGPHLDALALLRDRHLAPPHWRPGVRAEEIIGFDDALRGVHADLKRAMRAMPPLLRSYLAMGGWVSDHAVIDRALGTIHVFTGVEIAAVPPARARLLRALAG